MNPTAAACRATHKFSQRRVRCTTRQPARWAGCRVRRSCRGRAGFFAICECGAIRPISRPTHARASQLRPKRPLININESVCDSIGSVSIAIAIDATGPTDKQARRINPIHIGRLCELCRVLFAFVLFCSVLTHPIGSDRVGSDRIGSVETNGTGLSRPRYYSIGSAGKMNGARTDSKRIKRQGDLCARPLYSLARIKLTTCQICV